MQGATRWLLLVPLVLLLCPSTADARDARGGSKASKFDKVAKRHYKAGEHDDALAAFEAAYDANPLPKAKGRKKVRARINVLLRKLRKSASEMRIDASEPGALVQVAGAGGTANGVAPFSAWLAFGEHELTISLEGFETYRRALVVRPGAPTQLVAMLLLGAAEADGASASIRPAPFRGGTGEDEWQIVAP